MTKSENQNAKSHGAYVQILSPAKKSLKFEKLHRKLIKHFSPSGVLQHAIIRDLATLWWHKRQFDKWHAREFANFLRDIDMDEGTQSDFHDLNKLDLKIAEVERDFNEKNIKLAKRVIVAKGKHADRLRVEIVQLDEARRGALAPLHTSRERMRVAREDSPNMRNFERLEKAKATMDAKFDRCLRRLAMAKTFDELHTSKLLEYQPTKSPINATARQAKVTVDTDYDPDDRENDNENEQECDQDQSNSKTPKNKNSDTDWDFPGNKKFKKSEDDEDWGPAKVR